LLFAGFAAAVVALLPRASGADCGCFGAVMPAQIGLSLAVRNVCCAFAAAFGFMIAWHSSPPPIPLADVLVAIISITAIVLGSEVRQVRRALAGQGEGRS